MTIFDDRENAFEAKFARDADFMFRVLARRDKLIGAWAAGLMGLSGEEADAYARAVVTADMSEPGDEDVIRKLTGDLAAAQADADEAAVRAKLAEMTDEAHRQLMDPS